jgi:hypothetical protein
MIIILACMYIIGGLMGAFIPDPTYILVEVLSSIIGIFGILICSNECLWLFKSEKLNKKLIWQLRGIDLISLVVGTGIVISWWTTNKNWISSDIIGGCVVIAFIKCFKFTSMKMALAMLVTILILEVIGAIIIYKVMGQSYNITILNNFNSPMFLQLPTINVLIDQRCAWLPVTEIIFPGMLLSYLRRHDMNRKTHVYLIMSSIGFCIGSMVWMIMTILNIHAWPFALVS